jgi:hypothetical protein
MRRLALVAVGILVALFVASQLLVAPYAEHRISSRLTADGGHATVELSAFPALRLLAGDGDRIRVRAEGIDLALATPLVTQPGRVLGRLDKFGSVDIRVGSANAGPFKLQSISLERSGGQPYRVSIDASATAADLATYTGGQIAGDIGGFLGSLAGSALPFSDEPVPIQVDSVVRSDGGRPVVVSSSGMIAGISIDPLVEALSVALAGRV